MEDLELARWLGGKNNKRLETQITAGRTRTYTGVALGDSQNGKVIVDMGGDNISANGGQGIEIACSPQVKEGDRVTVTVVNGTPQVTGVVGWGDYVGDQAAFASAYVGSLTAREITADKLEASVAYIDDIEAQNVTVETLNAAGAIIADLEAGEITTDAIAAANAQLENLISLTLTADNIEAIKAYIRSLKVNKLEASDIIADHAAIDQLDANYAKIDLANVNAANINVAKIGQILAQSGIIRDMVVQEGTVTGTLAGVVINGDLINANTLRADRLIIQGTDGLYHALNVDALGQAAISTFTPEEQAELNSGLHGSAIIAKSITADKISVTDLTAFGATIAGSVMEQLQDGTYVLHSATKTGLSTGSGFWLDDNGNFSIGNASEYIRFNASTGKIEISASQFSIAVAEVKKASVTSVSYEWAENHSTDTAPTSGWSATQPTQTNDNVIWRRPIYTKGDGTTSTGTPEVASAPAGRDAVTVQIVSTAGTAFKNSAINTTLEASVFKGGTRIEDITTLRSTFGAAAYLQWSWRPLGANTFSIIGNADPRLTRSGFALTLTPEDIDTQAVFACDLMY